MSKHLDLLCYSYNPIILVGTNRMLKRTKHTLQKTLLSGFLFTTRQLSCSAEILRFISYYSYSSLNICLVFLNNLLQLIKNFYLQERRKQNIPTRVPQQRL